MLLITASSASVMPLCRAAVEEASSGTAGGGDGEARSVTLKSIQLFKADLTYSGFRARADTPPGNTRLMRDVAPGTPELPLPGVESWVSAALSRASSF